MTRSRIAGESLITAETWTSCRLCAPGVGEVATASWENFTGGERDPPMSSFWVVGALSLHLKHLEELRWAVEDDFVLSGQVSGKFCS